MAHPAFAPLASFAFKALEPLGVRPKTRLSEPFLPPAGARIAGMLKAKEYDNLRFTLSRLHRDSLRSTADALIDKLGEEEKSDQWLERLWEWYGDNKDINARIMLIYGLMAHAGQKQQSERMEAAREAFVSADNLLEAAVGSQPDFIDLLCLRLTTARALSLPANEHWNRFRALSAVDPLHYRGHLLMLENLSPRSGGSLDAMFRFARARSSQAPEGSAIRSLIVNAHFEACELGGCEAGGGFGEYFCKRETAGEVEAAWHDSVGSPNFRDESSAEALSNLFAAALFLADFREPARTALNAMDGHCLEYPWRLLAASPKELANVGWVVDRISARLNSE
jgi:hypothetical protein